MFGYAAFAQPTFAGLGNAQYAVSVSEAITYADVESALRTAFANISEAIISDIDVDAVIATFTANITENLNYADLDVANATFINAITEGLNAKDLETVIKIYNSSIAENINLSEKLLGAAWIQINDSQSSNWVIIDNRQ